MNFISGINGDQPLQGHPEGHHAKDRTMKIDKHSPLLPAPYTAAESYAIRMLAQGEATPAQQRLALDWMIHKLCRTYDEPFRPGADGARETDYALGKAHVGRQLVKHANGVPGLETPKPSAG
jgi:hypothetical protein